MENINLSNNSESAKKTAGNQSAVKTMKVLEVLADYSQPMRLFDLAKAAKMNASTAHKIFKLSHRLRICVSDKRHAEIYAHA